jgi:hypothetical protein
MRLNLSKFKKIHSDEKHTVLQSPAGHQFKVVHAALSPGNKKQLSDLPFHKVADAQGLDEGGEAANGAPSLDPDKVKAFTAGFTGHPAPAPTPPPQPKAQGGQIFNSSPDGTTMNNLAGYADGGDTKDTDDEPETQPTPNVIGDSLFAHGGEANASMDDVKALVKQLSELVASLKKNNEAAPKKMAGGGDTGTDNEEAAAQKELETQQQMADVEAANNAPQRAEALLGTQGVDVQPQAEARAKELLAEDQNPPGSTTAELGDKMPDNSMQPAPSNQPSLLDIMRQRQIDQSQPKGQQMPADDMNKYGLSALEGDVAQQAQGLRQQSGAQQQEARENATAQATHGAALNEIGTKFNDNVKDLRNKASDVLQQLAGKDGQIDPNRYMSNLPAAQKITTGIAALIGGLSGHQESLNFLNQNIQNDIDAQKANIGTKKSLVDYLYRDIGNVNAATEMALGIKKAAIANTLEQNKNKAIAGSPQNPGLAEANMNQAIGKLKFDANQHLQQAAIFQSLQQMDQNKPAIPPGQINLQKFNLLQRSGMMPKEDVSASTKEAQSYEQANKEWKNIEQAYRDVQHVSNWKAHVPFSEAKAKIDSAKADVVASFEKVMGRRIPTEQLEMMAPMFPTASDTQSQTQQKLIRMQDLFSSNRPGAPTLERYGLINNKPQHVASLNPREGQVAINKTTGKKLKQVNGQFIPSN